MSLSLKVTYGDDLRRFSVSSDISFAELRSFIEKHLGVSNLLFRYIDDEEEVVTIGSNIELEEAKRLQPSRLRLIVSDSQNSQKVVVPEEEKKKTELKAALIQHITIPDGLQVTVNTPFRKIWRLKNDGEVDWPENVKLCLIGPEDYQLGGALAGVSARPVKVGEQIDIATDLKAPPTEGRYLGFWKLMSGNEPFGPRIHVDVAVVASRAEEEEAKRKMEADRKRAEEDEKRKQMEERKREEELLRQEEEERLRREEEECCRQEEERLRREEEERLRREEEERLRREEEERLRREEEERRRQEEERLRREEEEHRRQEEERRRQEEELRKLEEEMLAREAEEKAKRAAEEAKRKAEEEELARFQYAEQYRTIVDMGFGGQVAKLKELLITHKGNIEAVLDSLLSGN